MMRVNSFLNCIFPMLFPQIALVVISAYLGVEEERCSQCSYTLHCRSRQYSMSLPSFLLRRIFNCSMGKYICFIPFQEPFLSHQSTPLFPQVHRKSVLFLANIQIAPLIHHFHSKVVLTPNSQSRPMNILFEKD